MATINQHPIRLNIIGKPIAGNEVEIRVLIGHPMETGFRFADGGNARIAKNIIENVVIKFNQVPIMIGQLGTGVSANPLLSIFMTVPTQGGIVSVEWQDDKGVQGRAERAILVT